MSNLISRRTALTQLAVIGAASAAAHAVIAPVSAAAAADLSSARIPQTAVADLARRDGFVPVESLRAEYITATEMWPFPTPARYRLPARSGLVDPAGETAQWERGGGVAEAHSRWSTLTARAAYAAHLRGDHETAYTHLRNLITAYDSDTARAFIDDPERLYVVNVVMPALERNDYSALVEFHQLKSLDRVPALAAIARAAGDL